MTRTLAMLAALGALLAGCRADDSPRIGTMMPDYALPGDTLKDWVSFGDQLSVVSVLDETPLRLPRDWKNSGGIIPREVTLRVDRTLWRRPEAPRLRGTIQLDAWGWMMETDQRADSPTHPITGENGPRLEVGGRYLTVLVRLRGEWFPINDMSVMTLAGDTVTSEVAGGEPGAGAAALKGRTIREAAVVVRTTEPYAKAAAHPRLSPLARQRLALDY